MAALPARPGELGQAVPLDVLGVSETDRPQPLGGEPVVDLVEMLLDQRLLLIGGLAPVRLAGVLQRRVVPVALGGVAGGAGPGRRRARTRRRP